MAMMILYGVGMLVSTIQSMSAQGELNQMSQQLQAQNQKAADSLRQLSQMNLRPKEPTWVKSTFDFEAPPFPEKNYKNLQDMQMKNAVQRQEATQKLHNELQDKKAEFFGNNHYETTTGPDGKPKVALDENGQPKVAKGPEGPEQKIARLSYESTKKAELQDKHQEQRQAFLDNEKQTMQDFLAQNKENLNNPYVQGELQKMVVDTKKKQLQLQQQQEDERFRVDMPPSQEIVAALSSGMQDLRQMDQKNVEAEENSPDAMALMEHDQKVAAILGEQKERARNERSEDEFLKDPRKMFATAVANRPQKDVGESLPGYLTNALYDLGIYAV